MILRMILVLALAAGDVSLSTASIAGSALASAPIDYSLYRDGEVRRSERMFARWFLTCDVIERLHQRFCSLKSVARAGNGTIVAAVTVSTDERGRPAALVTLPFGVSLARGMTILPSSNARGADTKAPRQFQMSQCGGLGCQAVWPISSGEIQRLCAGDAILIHFEMGRRPVGVEVAEVVPVTAITGTVDAAGFAEALKASLN